MKMIFWLPLKMITVVCEAMGIGLLDFGLMVLEFDSSFWGIWSLVV